MRSEIDCRKLEAVKIMFRLKWQLQAWALGWSTLFSSAWFLAKLYFHHLYLIWNHTSILQLISIHPDWLFISLLAQSSISTNDKKSSWETLDIVLEEDSTLFWYSGYSHLLLARPTWHKNCINLEITQTENLSLSVPSLQNASVIDYLYYK